VRSVAEREYSADMDIRNRAMYFLLKFNAFVYFLHYVCTCMHTGNYLHPLLGVAHPYWRKRIPPNCAPPLGVCTVL